MTEHSRRSFLKSAAVSGALTTGAVLLPVGLAGAATATSQGLGRRRAQVPQTRSTTYRLHVKNDSNAFEQFAVYQNDPDLGVFDVMSLAWLVKGAHPQQTITFEWTEDYSFAVIARTSPTQILQSVPVDPYNPAKQQALLGYANGALTLQPGQAVPDPQFGSIYLRELGNVPDDGVGLVGLAISGAPTYAMTAAPNENVDFTPKTGANYWIAGGNFTAGAGLDVEEIVTPAAIDFAPGVFDLTAVLGPDNTWAVGPTPSTGGGTAGPHAAA
jgi:rhizosphere induced protein